MSNKKGKETIQKLRFARLKGRPGYYHAQLELAPNASYWHFVFSLEGQNLTATTFLAPSKEITKSLEPQLTKIKKTYYANTLSAAQNFLNSAVDHPKSRLEKYKLFDLDSAKHRNELVVILDKLEKKQKTAQPKGADLFARSWKTATAKQKNAVLGIDIDLNRFRVLDDAKFESLPLPFYKNVDLIRVKGGWQPKELAFYFLHDGTGAVQLTGKSNVIHAMNRKGKIQLTKDNVALYLWYFGFFVHGEEGPFLNVESIKTSHVPNRADYHDKIRKHLKPAKCASLSDRSGYSCKVTIIYSNALFSADMEVKNDGNVSMKSDTPLQANLQQKIDAPITLAATGKRYRPAGSVVATKSNKAAKIQAKPAPKPAPKPKKSGSWRFKSETDVMTNKLKQFVFGIPEGYENRKNPPYIRIGCYNAGDQYPMGVTFYWGVPLNNIYPNGEIPATTITSKFGSAKPLELGWSLSRDYRETWPPSGGLKLAGGLANGILGAFAPNNRTSKTSFGWNAKRLHKALRGASYSNPKKAIFRAYPISGAAITLSFDMTGYTKAVSQFRSHCNR